VDGPGRPEPLDEELPDLVARPGGSDFFTPQVWISYMVLWTLCDPMFQRRGEGLQLLLCPGALRHLSFE